MTGDQVKKWKQINFFFSSLLSSFWEQTCAIRSAVERPWRSPERNFSEKFFFSPQQERHVVNWPFLAIASIARIGNFAAK